jgi:hypothetical protein
MFDQVTQYTVHGKTYEQKHGNAFDRGSADSWYGRGRNPHKGGVGGNSGPRVIIDTYRHTKGARDD